MLLIVGLGNPGNKYAENRHNIGFMAVDEIVCRHNFLPERKRFNALTHEGKLGDTKVLVIKPQTYMNNSGQSVAEAARFYKVDADSIIVFHDELDLAAGKIRVKQGGGHAGHNGLRSITDHMGANFHRVRVGIGHPGDKAKVHNHVLGDFAKSDMGWVTALTDEIGRRAKWLTSDITRFQAEVTQAVAPSKPTTDKASAPKATKANKAAPAKATKDTPSEGPMAAALKALKKLTGDK